MMNLKNKNDYLELFNQINQPLRNHYRGKSRIMYGSTGVGYGNQIAGVEGFARMMWGAGPAFENLDKNFKREIIQGILAGTSPEDSNYWGDLHDRDQRMVEMPAIALALIHNDCYLWNEISVEKQKQIVSWMKQIFDHECADGNWQFFKIVVYEVLKKLQISVNKNNFLDAKKKIEKCYREDGWYKDSSRGRRDYYTAFAFHYYGILYSTLEPDDPWSDILRQRASLFSEQFIHFFDKEGSNVPFGRSMTYRYAAVAFWTAMVYGNVNQEKIGTYKGIINRNIRWWLKQPIFDDNKLLTLGYGYSQLSMTEPYNSPVSPYWSNKIFLLLGLPENHEYWDAKEEEFPLIETPKILQSPNLFANYDDEHTVLLNAGQPGPNYHALTNEKYFKFAYSSKFGFSIPRGNQLKEEMVMDSSLGIQTLDTKVTVSQKGKIFEETGMFYTRNNCQDVRIDQNYIASTWKINDQMQIRTWLLWINNWQIRIHRINCERDCVTYETGFAVKDVPDNFGEITTSEIESYFDGLAGFTGIINLTPELDNEDCTIHGFPNTNLMTSEVVVLPGRVTYLQPGETWIATGVYAHPNLKHAKDLWKAQPKITLSGINLQVESAQNVIHTKLR